MIVIFADASYEFKTGAAGWGCWIKADGLSSIIHGGRFKGTITSVAHAEICALVNAVAVAQLSGALTDTTVMLQSDSMEALAAVRLAIDASDSPHPNGGLAILKRRKAPEGPWLPALNNLKAALAGKKVLVRHVKGHQPGRGRSWVNRQCDSEAKRHRKAAQRSMVQP